MMKLDSLPPTNRTRLRLPAFVSSAVLFLFSVALLLAEERMNPDLVLRGGWLFDATGDSVDANTGLVIRAGKFLRVGENLEGHDLSDTAVIELGPDDYVLPGMFDLHAHYAMDLMGRGRIDETGAYPELFLANGVTSTYPAGEVNPERMQELRIEIDAKRRIGPRLFNSGPYFGRARAGWKADIPLEQIRKEVDEWAARGVRCFKAKGITAEHLSVLVERAHLHGLPVSGHLGSGFKGSVNPRDAILMGIDRVEHFLGGDGLTPDKSAYSSLENLEPGPELDDIISLYLSHGVFFDATLTAYGYFGKRDPEVFTYFTDELQYLTPYMLELLKERGRREPSEQFEKIYWV